MARALRQAAARGEVVVPWRQDPQVVRLTAQIAALHSKAATRLVKALVEIGQRMAAIQERLPRGAPLRGHGPGRISGLNHLNDRWRTTDLFHLFGFRRACARTDGLLVYSRRRPDRAGRRQVPDESRMLAPAE